MTSRWAGGVGFAVHGGSNEVGFPIGDMAVGGLIQKVDEVVQFVVGVVHGISRV